MQCLLVGIEIIHKNPASPTHSARREAFNASVGRDRSMTHCSCLHLESKKKRGKIPNRQSNKIKTGRKKNKGNEGEDSAAVTADHFGVKTIRICDKTGL